MKLLRIVPSTNKSKKYDAIFMIDGKEKKVSFGQNGARDYTLISNKSSKFYLPKILDRNVVRDSYRRRHIKDLKTNDPTRPGYLSYYLLWSRKTLNASIKDYKKKFSL